MSDCAMPNGRWSGVHDTPRSMPMPRRDGTDVLHIDPLVHYEDVAAAREVVIYGIRFVRARVRDWDDLEVE